MIDPEEQEFKLKKFVLDELKLRTVKKRMIATLRNKKQSYSGTLKDVIEKMSFNKSVKVTNTSFDKTTGFMIKGTVEFRFDFKKAGYAKFLEKTSYTDIPFRGKKKGGIDALVKWIMKKDLSTFKTQIDRSDGDKVRRLAHAIFRSQKNRGKLENTSNFISFTRSNITTSINKASESFVNYLSDKLYLELKSQIFYR